MDRRTFCWGIGALGTAHAARNHLPKAIEASVLAQAEPPLHTMRVFTHPDDFSRIPHSTIHLYALQSEHAASLFFESIAQGPPEFVGVPCDGGADMPDIYGLGHDRLMRQIIPVNRDTDPEGQGITARTGKLVAMWGAQSFGRSAPATWHTFHTVTLRYLGTFQDTKDNYTRQELQAMLPTGKELGPGWSVRSGLIDEPPGTRI